MSPGVVDSSALVAYILDSGPDGRWAEEQLSGLELAAPHLVLVEASNIVRRAVLLGDVNADEASAAHADICRLDIELFEFAPFAPRVWELRANVTSYDAWYVALAEALECPLVTLDRRLAGAAGLHCPVSVPSA